MSRKDEEKGITSFLAFVILKGIHNICVRIYFNVLLFLSVHTVLIQPIFSLQSGSFWDVTNVCSL